jgi:4-amino-4-deoxy-L-arabinose transferase-like glycosyltransferase
VSLLQAIESRRALVVLFLLGAVLRAILLPRAVDQASWRECDLAGIARNFDREGMNPFYPRIDWRGNTPGFAEMEFPACSWMMAVCYRVFGRHEVIGRVLSYGISLLALAIFFRLSRELLTPAGAFFAALFFTLAPLAVVLSTAIQPEPLMLLASLLAVFYFIRWLRTASLGMYFVAMAATAATILAKAPAAHLGILFAVLLLSWKGWRSLLSPLPWLFALGALTPPLLWYIHARNFWLTYGNSLGVSNEYHWIGRDVFTDPELLLGVIRLEILVVWTPVGLLLGCFGAMQAGTNPTARLALYWLGAAGVFYLAAIRTTSSNWAYYYHIASLPAAALLVGAGAEAGLRLSTNRLRRALCGLALVGTYLAEMALIVVFIEKKQEADPLYQEAGILRPALSEEGLILVTGGSSLGRTGYPVAYNNSYLFYWLDRKGFNISMEQLNMDNLRSFQTRGARYFIAEKKHLAGAPEFGAEVGPRYPLVAETENLLAYRLAPAPDRPIPQQEHNRTDPR